MTKALFLLCALALCAPAHAAAGDAVVPAHRTRDGSFVPANVPPLSGGTHLARRPARSTARAQHGNQKARPAITAPIFVEAPPMRR
ncbi:MAG: hypothetical protein ABJA61_02835 [Caldimonas sp.]